MEELQISGKRYISSQRAAKDNKYHSDYIGQLVRAGKVAGQKVGRAWYVEADSLAVYLGKEAAQTTPMAHEVVGEVATTSVVEEKKEEVKIVPAVATVQKVKEVVEEKIEKEEKEIDLDLHRIPIHSPTASVARAMHAKKNNKLTYITDDTPFFPRVQTRKARIETPEEIYQQEEIKEPTIVQPARKSFFRQWGVVAVLSIAAFIFVVGSSYLFTYTATVDEGEMSATVSLGTFNL